MTMLLAARDLARRTRHCGTCESGDLRGPSNHLQPNSDKVLKIGGLFGQRDRKSLNYLKSSRTRITVLIALELLIDPSAMELTVRQVGIEFLRTEVEMALVFSRIASGAQDSEKRLRNVQNARTGYDALLHFMQILTLTADERAEMQLEASELRQQLINLGENL